MRIPVVLATVSLATVLAACSTYEAQAPATSAPARAKLATTEMPFRAGVGTVTAATRSSAAPYRLVITMNDGSTQVIDTDAPDIAVGSRVELTPDRVIRKL